MRIDRLSTFDTLVRTLFTNGAGARRQGNRVQPDQRGFESHLRLFEWKVVDIICPAACRPPGRDWHCLFREWVLTRECRRRLAQWIEHQIYDLGVTGSTPVPTPPRRLVADTDPFKSDNAAKRVTMPEGGRRPCRSAGACARANPHTTKVVPWCCSLTMLRQHAATPCSAWIPRLAGSG